MSEKLFRTLEILKLIPRHPNKITAGQLTDKLSQLGYTVHKRSIERQLHDLSVGLPLLCDEREKPYGWSFKAGSAYGKSDMSTADALSHLLAFDHLKDVLPKELAANLAPQAQEAEAIMRFNASGKLQAWRNKVRNLPRGFALQPADVQGSVLNAVYQSLFDEVQLEVTYRGREKQIINPHGLILRGQAMYLITTFWEYNDIRQLALHRIDDATCLKATAIINKDFNLEKYIGSNAMGVLYKSSTLKIKLQVSKNLARLLDETPLSTDQVIDNAAGDNPTIKATVPNTLELRQWLMSQASAASVISPVDLKNDIMSRLRSAIAAYE